MKVLFISKLEGHKWQGPTHSVPMQIKHQSNIDEVLWVNLCASINPEWKDLPYYRESEKGLKTRLADMPADFQKPDIVVFEGVYEYPFAGLVYDLWARKIPYVAVPRSALTADAQKKKPLKKLLGNMAFFNVFVGKAAAIQYLTAAEQKDSAKWKTPSFVVPNGMLPKERTKQTFSNEGLIFSYIGRMEQYQKGLDLLVSACSRIVRELRAAKVTIHLYGPDREGSFAQLREELARYSLEDIIFLHDGVFGEDKERVQLESDAFIMTSRFEGLPMGMIEALAYGLPALATTGTNLAEEIRDAEAGWTSDNSVDGIAQMLRAAVADKDRYPERSQNALGLSAQYNWQAIAEKTHGEFSNIINRGK